VALFALFALTSLVAVAHAQEPASGRIESIDDSDFPEVRAIVTLVDDTGRPIVGLKAADFTVEETGAAADTSSVETVLDQQLGVAVILVVDTSGSMDGPPIAQARNAAQAFVENLAEPDQAAVISFADSVVVDSALTSERSESLAAINDLAALGNTALYSGVVVAVEQARDASLPRKAILLLSDGQDFGGASQDSRQQSLDLVAEARVPIYAIGLGQDIDRPFLEELAEASGGSFIEAPAPESIPEIYDQLSQLLRSQYVVTLQSTAPPEASARSLRIVVETPEGEVEVSSDYTTSRAIVVLTTAPQATPTAAAIPAAVGSQQPVEEDSGGGLLVPLFLIFLALAAVSGSYLYYKRLKKQRALEQQIEVMGRRAASEMDDQGATPIRPIDSETTHRIHLTGPGLDEPFEIGAEPMVIGSQTESQIHLPASEGVASVHARFWVREGKLVLHHLAPGYESTVGGRSVTWVTLDPGDEVQIGPYLARIEG